MTTLKLNFRDKNAKYNIYSIRADLPVLKYFSHLACTLIKSGILLVDTTLPLISPVMVTGHCCSSPMAL